MMKSSQRTGTPAQRDIRESICWRESSNWQTQAGREILAHLLYDTGQSACGHHKVRDCEASKYPTMLAALSQRRSEGKDLLLRKKVPPREPAGHREEIRAERRTKGRERRVSKDRAEVY